MSCLPEEDTSPKGKVGILPVVNTLWPVDNDGKSPIKGITGVTDHTSYCYHRICVVRCPVGTKAV